MGSMRKKKRLTLQNLFGRKYRLQYADYLRLKTELGIGMEKILFGLFLTTTEHVH